MFAKLLRSLILFVCLFVITAIFTIMPVMAARIPEISAEGNAQATSNNDDKYFSAKLDTTIPTIPETNSQPTANTSTPSSTVIIQYPTTGEFEDEEPLSWWLITIIIVGGLVIILVTWRLIRRAGHTS